jgi:hypothetical protein
MGFLRLGSVAQLTVTIRPPGRPSYTISLDRLTETVTAARSLKLMARLSNILKRGTDAIAGLETAVEKDVDKLIARTNEVHDKREKVFLRKHMNLDAHVTDLVEFDRELDAFHNGGGPLDDGADTSDSSKSEPPKAWEPPKA